MIDDKNIDPELLPVFSGLPAISDGRKSLEEIQGIFQEFKLPEVPIVDGVSVTNRGLSRSSELGDILVRIYQPSDRAVDEDLPALLWMHGGGFIGGDVYQNDALCGQIAAECHCVVVSVDYRLAPQYLFPKGLNDCYAALLWLASEGIEELKVDLDRIAVGGCSAGGCLAAGVALRARDVAGPKVDYQLLMIPVLDDRHETPSAQSVTDARVWNRQLSMQVWSRYLSKVEGEPPAYAAPARAEDLSGLPPTFVSVEEQDLLRDEGIDYAQRLARSNVQTELHVYPGTYHGSVLIEPTADITKYHIRDVMRALKKRLWREQLRRPDFIKMKN